MLLLNWRTQINSPLPLREGGIAGAERKAIRGRGAFGLRRNPSPNSHALSPLRSAPSRKGGDIIPPEVRMGTPHQVRGKLWEFAEWGEGVRESEKQPPRVFGYGSAAYDASR